MKLIKTIILTGLLAGFYSAAQSPQSDISQQETASKIFTTTDNDIISPTLSVFPMARYPQDIERWIPPAAPGSNIAVLDNTSQERYFSQLKSHYFGTGANDHSPWNDTYSRTLPAKAREIISQNSEKWLSTTAKSYGLNDKALPLAIRNEIKINASVAVPDASAGEAVTIRETLVRALPTIDPIFNDPRLAGEGYPFDNLQMSAIRAGTPLYVLTSSKDKAWKYVESPTVSGWVKSDDIASVDNNFISAWRALAEKQLGAFMKEPVSVTDGYQFHFTGRPGTILPLRKSSSDDYLVAIPEKKLDGSAQIKWVSVSKEEVMPMPIKMTPNNIAYLIGTMLGRPYGWGNFNFHNDCSTELRSLLMPFGIFLPRNSATQATVGRIVDLSQDDVHTRIDYLATHGKPFTTLIHIDGHIMLYVGNNTEDGNPVPVTYQNIWGLRTQHSPGRSIIGSAVFFPLLATYPENTDLLSPAARPIFSLSFIE